MKRASTLCRGAVLAATTAIALAAPVRARAETVVQACLNASEKGQRARAAGKLREAREQFLICGNDECPALVRRDCAQWQSDLVSTIPTVVFGAKDKAGRDMLDVTVTMDGEVVAKKLDGKAVTCDPGPHTFKFEYQGFQPVTQKALVKEGEKTRSINVAFAESTNPEADAAAKPPVDGAGHDPGHDNGANGEEARGHTPYPWVLVGLGAIGAVVGGVVVATTPARPPNCDKTSEKCTPSPSTESAADLQNDETRAGKADSQPVLGFAIIAGSAIAIAGGLLWHFLEPTGPDKRGALGVLRVSPWAAPGTAGGAVRVTF